jgi:hypothetical protein
MIRDKNTKGNSYWLYPFASRDCTMIVRRPIGAASTHRFVPTSGARDMTVPLGLPRASTGPRTLVGCGCPGHCRRMAARLQSVA